MPIVVITESGSSSQIQPVRLDPTEKIVPIRSGMTQAGIPLGTSGLQGPPGASGVKGETGNVGPQGATGATGATGSGGDLTYDHFQASASAVWVITHGLGKRPSVIVIDSGGSECEGSVSYDSINQITITFSAAFGGHAYLN